MVRFSIIVPVYNCEKYINECIDSILNQTYENFELILVDDGSPDDSGAICDEYAKKDSRIQVYHQENKGLYMTRLCARKYISGKYGLFVDSDDFVAENWLEKIDKAIETTSADIVIFDCNKGDRTGAYRYYESMKGYTESVLFEEKNLNELYPQYFASNTLNPVCFKAINASLLQDDSNFTVFDRLNTGEDAVFSSKLLLKAKKIYYLRDALYFYRFNEKSIINTFSFDKIRDWGIMLKEKHDFRVAVNANDAASLEKMATFCVEMCVFKIFMFTTAPITLKKKIESLKEIKQDFFYKEYAKYINPKALPYKRRISNFLLKNSMYYTLLFVTKLFWFVSTHLK